MNLRNKALDTAEKLFEISLFATKPVLDVKSAISPKSSEIDTQELTERAHLIIESDANQALFARMVLVELDAGRISPEQADSYLILPTE